MGSLPPVPTAFQRARSRLAHSVVGHAVPASLLVTRGSRRGGARRVALTFDDGPDEMTPRYLETLDRLDVRATFFVIGANAERWPARVLEYVAQGHEVAGHGFTHTPFPDLAPAVLVDELVRTADLLPPCRSPRPFVRPPQGRVTARSLARVAAAGYRVVLWSVDSDDCRTRDPHAVAERLAPSRVESGDIVLLHELQPWTLTALQLAVGRLRDAGFELVTVGEIVGV